MSTTSEQGLSALVQRPPRGGTAAELVVLGPVADLPRGRAPAAAGAPSDGRDTTRACRSHRGADRRDDHIDPNGQPSRQPVPRPRCLHRPARSARPSRLWSVKVSATAPPADLACHGQRTIGLWPDRSAPVSQHPQTRARPTWHRLPQHRRTPRQGPLPVPHSCATPRPLTLHMQLPAPEPGAVPCSCDAGEHTERLTGQGPAMPCAGRVGSGPAARSVSSYAAPGRRLRQESQLSSLSVNSSVALMTRRAMATIPGWRRRVDQRFQALGQCPTASARAQLASCRTRPTQHNLRASSPAYLRSARLSDSQRPR